MMLAPIRIHGVARVGLAALGCLVLMASSAAAQGVESVTIFRDEFGTPHIYAETEEGASFGLGYAQAEDRLEQLFRQYRQAIGTMSEVFGPEWLRHDYRQRQWDHAGVSQKRYGDVSPKSRARIEAFLAGVRQYMADNPDKVPESAMQLEGWHVIALGRFIIWGWPEGDAAGDLKRAGIEPDSIEERGSNEWVVAASRTTLGAPVALIDPHLSFYGAFRFYECRMYGGDIAVSGMAVVGLEAPSTGHNQYLSYAKTTGGPDSSDVYEEEVDPQNPRRYRYDGEWREMTVRKEVIHVKEGDTIGAREYEIESTHHGPVVARKDGKAHAARLSYADEVHLTDQNYKMITAKNLAEFKASLAMLQLMPQNVMTATVDGDIFYVRNGRIPIRPAGYDVSRPLPGNTSKSEWQGIHPFEDLLQLENPPQGYMQNCNVSPQFITRDCPLQPEKWQDRFYLFNRDNPLHQRAAMTLSQLAADDSVTLEDAMQMAMSTEVYGADKWQARLEAAWQAAGDSRPSDAASLQLHELIADWNRRCDADSVGAVAYHFWKKELGDEVTQSDRAGRDPPETVTDQQILEALTRGAAALEKTWGKLAVPYGEVYRIGRFPTDAAGRPEGQPAQNWPVGGGSVPGISTPRAISYDPTPDGRTFMARGGQTSPQLVVLSKPPRSYTVIPLGESDDPNSAHYDDQAEKVFSPGILKPTYFLDRKAVEEHAQSKTDLKYNGPRVDE